MMIVVLLMTATVVFAQSSLLTATEKEDILFMLEEEKMARDVYLTFQEKWDLTVFKHISEAEQRHIDLLTQLAEDEGIWYPKALTENKKGVFEKSILGLISLACKLGTSC